MTVEEWINSGEINSRTWLNQEKSFLIPENTRWVLIIRHGCVWLRCFIMSLKFPSMFKMKELMTHKKMSSIWSSQVFSHIWLCVLYATIVGYYGKPRTCQRLYKKKKIKTFQMPSQLWNQLSRNCGNFEKMDKIFLWINFLLFVIC